MYYREHKWKDRPIKNATSHTALVIASECLCHKLLGNSSSQSEKLKESTCFKILPFINSLKVIGICVQID